jgi:hypothetical protein
MAVVCPGDVLSVASEWRLGGAAEDKLQGRTAARSQMRGRLDGSCSWVHCYCCWALRPARRDLPAALVMTGGPRTPSRAPGCHDDGHDTTRRGAGPAMVHGFTASAVQRSSGPAVQRSSGPAVHGFSGCRAGWKRRRRRRRRRRPRCSEPAGRCQVGAPLQRCTPGGRGIR